MIMKFGQHQNSTTTLPHNKPPPIHELRFDSPSSAVLKGILEKDLTSFERNVTPQVILTTKVINPLLL